MYVSVVQTAFPVRNKGLKEGAQSAENKSANQANAGSKDIEQKGQRR